MTTSPPSSARLSGTWSLTRRSFPRNHNKVRSWLGIRPEPTLRKIARRIQQGAQLFAERVGGKRLVDERGGRGQARGVDDAPVGVAGHEQHFEPRAQPAEALDQRDT